MTQTHRRLAVATAVSAILVVAAPYIGMVRSQVRAAFPGQFGTMVDAVVGVALAGALVWALTGVRSHRLARYGAIALAFAAGAAYSRATDSADPAVRAVEHFHFVEYGIITLLYYRAWRPRLDLSALFLPVLATFVVGIADEAVQWFVPARVGELRDVWLNGAAIGCGLLFGVGFEPPAPFTAGWRPGSRRMTANTLAMAVIALAAFVRLVHIGVEIRDVTAGTFGSRYTAAELVRLGAGRAEQWKTAPPTTRPPRFSREDQYMTEGLQHVQARNTAWDAGDAFAAWHENLILEKWFAPVLDSPSYVSATGHRWSAEHRADAAARVEGTDGREFISRAYPYPLYYWPGFRLWLVAVVVAGVLVLVGQSDAGNIAPLLVAVMLPWFWQTAAAQPRSALEPYVSANRLYMLYKPADWRVVEEPQPGALRVRVLAPDRASMVDFVWARNEAGVPNALAFLVSCKRSLSLQLGEVTLGEVFVSPDAGRATAKVRYRAAAGFVSGRYYVESRPAGQSAQGYFAPEPRLATQRPLLLNVMASFTFAKGAASAAGRGAAPSPPPVPLTPRRAPDGSLSIRVPPDWNFLAGGGKVITAARDGSMGFIFTSFSGNPMLPQASIAQGIIGTRYLPPDQALAYVFNAFKNQQFRIHSVQADQATVRECVARSGSACDARDFQVSYVSPEGRACVGGFKMINAPPSPATGLWFCLVAGIWGPEREFSRYFPTLEQVAASFTINDQYARRYIQAGLENLRRLQQKTQAAMQDLNEARAQSQKDWEAAQQRKEYMDARWDDYRRGRSYWVSDLEGGKVYATDTGGTEDTVTGQYYEGRPYNWVNFEGRNPKHPSETMREVTSAELKTLEGGRR